MKMRILPCQTDTFYTLERRKNKMFDHDIIQTNQNLQKSLQIFILAKIDFFFLHEVGVISHIE